MIEFLSNNDQMPLFQSTLLDPSEFYHPPHLDPKYSPRVRNWMSIEERFPTEALTHIIDFSETTSIMDPLVANDCVAVITSDGETGTLSHVSTYNKPRLFSNDLYSLLNGSRHNVFLSGGDSSISNDLVNGLIESLKEKGFTIEGIIDVLGSSLRQATLFNDRVEIKKHVLSGPPFPNAISTYPFPYTDFGK